jgi:Tfx family DNA-binding protein
MSNKSFLTKRQVMVLRLRQSGLTQDEIARRIKTTRANVSLIEKRARENIDRSRETLKEWESIVSPVRVIIKKGTDVINPRTGLRRSRQIGHPREIEFTGPDHPHKKR